MRATWQFRVVFKQRIFIAQRDGKPRIIEGTDTEALAFAAKVHAYFQHYDLLRVEAHSIDKVDFSIPNAQDDRVLFQLHQRGNRWEFEPNRHVPSAYAEDQDWCLNLAAIRARGYIIEVQIFEGDGRLAEVVVMNEDGDRLV